MRVLAIGESPTTRALRLLAGALKDETARANAISDEVNRIAAAVSQTPAIDAKSALAIICRRLNVPAATT